MSDWCTLYISTSVRKRKAYLLVGGRSYYIPLLAGVTNTVHSYESTMCWRAISMRWTRHEKERGSEREREKRETWRSWRKSEKGLDLVSFLSRVRFRRVNCIGLGSCIKVSFNCCFRRFSWWNKILNSKYSWLRECWSETLGDSRNPICRGYQRICNLPGWIKQGKI